MSKTQLQTNNARLSALITELQGKAAGGGSGGGSVETCTVTFSGSISSGYVYRCLIFEDGSVSFADGMYSRMMKTINNVLSNSFFIFTHRNSSVSVTGEGELSGMTYTDNGDYLLYVWCKSGEITITL